MEEKIKKQPDTKIKNFIEKLGRCLYAGDMELNIKLDIVHRHGENITILDASNGERFVIQISRLKKGD
jgi:hypothetical protein